MRVVVWPADAAGCGHYRLLFPARALAAQGHDVLVDHVGPLVEWSAPWSGPQPPEHVRVLGLRPVDADVVVLQRPGRRWWADLVPHLHGQGVRVVVDVDDRFDAIPQANVAHSSYRQAHVNHAWIDEACRLADVVTCTTPALLVRYGHGHGVVLPNLVPQSYLGIYGLKAPRTVGWPGTVESHPGDLASTGGGVAAALSGTDWVVQVTGTGWHVAEELRLPAAQLRVAGLVRFEEYPFAVAQLEIGIVPLREGPFNAAKSALKASEMAAVGVPVVMSPTPDNLRLHGLGVGLIAESRGQWRRQLVRLMASPAMRHELAEQGRDVMAGQTYEHHAWRWLEAWSDRAAVAA